MRILSFVLVSLLFPSVWANDCEPFHLFEARLGDSRSEVRAVLGEPYATSSDALDYELDWFDPETVRMFVRYNQENIAIFLSGKFTEQEHADVLESVIARFGEPTIRPTSTTAPYYRPGLVWKNEGCDAHVFSFKSDRDGEVESMMVELRRLSAKPMRVPGTRSAQTFPNKMTKPVPKGEGLTGKKYPDPNVDPLGFLRWRVDALFERGDTNSDGMMDRVEFRGETDSFEQMDVNGDGLLTQEEVVDHMAQILSAEGKIPAVL